MGPDCAGWHDPSDLIELKAVVIGFDYSAVEARVAAHIARLERNILMPVESWPLFYAGFYDELSECTWPWWQRAWWWLVDLVAPKGQQ